ncbi:MAG: phosphorylated adapter RNA export RNA-binding domain-containing protein [Aggregatilineales bacterium]
MTNTLESQPLTEQELKDAVKRITAELNETAPKPRRQITQIVESCGVEFVDQLLKETEEVEAQGGMLIEKGDRRRTKGGVFFYLARKNLPEDIRDGIFHNWRSTRKQYIEHESQFPEFDWDERLPLITELLSKPSGEATDVRVILTGRPGEIERRQNLVITTIDFEVNDALTLPIGVPDFPEKKLTYLLYISSKQWERVEEALKKPNDEMIVEGLCAFDPEIQQMAVYSTFVTTKKLQRKDRKQAKQEATQKAPPNRAQPPASNRQERPERKPKPKREFQPIETMPTVNVDLPDGITTAEANKLVQLHTAAAAYRLRISDLEAKPEGQGFMLNTTRKLLKDVETQIEDLENKYK